MVLFHGGNSFGAVVKLEASPNVRFDRIPQTHFYQSQMVLISTVFNLNMSTAILFIFIFIKRNFPGIHYSPSVPAYSF